MYPPPIHQFVHSPSSSIPGTLLHLRDDAGGTGTVEVREYSNGVREQLPSKVPKLHTVLHKQLPESTRGVGFVSPQQPALRLR